MSNLVPKHAPMSSDGSVQSMQGRRITPDFGVAVRSGIPASGSVSVKVIRPLNPSVYVARVNKKRNHALQERSPFSVAGPSSKSTEKPRTKSKIAAKKPSGRAAVRGSKPPPKKSVCKNQIASAPKAAKKPVPKVRLCDNATIEHQS